MVAVVDQSNPVRTLVAALLLCAALGAALTAELSAAGDNEPTEASAAPPPAADKDKDSAAVGRGFMLAPLSSFAEVTERPLFLSSRRPSLKETSKAADQPLNATLAGIVISNSSSSIIVTHGDPPVLMRLKQGDQIDGWSVQSIERARVLLQRRDGAEQHIKLHDAPGRTADEASAKPERGSRSHR